MAEPEKKQCQLCGAEYQPKKRAYRQKYCSVACRERQRQLEKDNRINVMPQRRCPVCGSTFQVESEKNRRKYCTKACRKACYNAKSRKAKPAEKQCLVCGNTFCCGSNVNQKYCSTQCRQKEARARAPKKQKHEEQRECPVCGGSFVVGGRAIGRRKYCSKACGARACKEHHAEAQALTAGQLEGKNCLNCDAVIEQVPGKKRRRYCDEKCERKFTYRTSPEQREEIRRQLQKPQPHGRPRTQSGSAKQEYICKYCGKTFEDWQYKQRVYCSRECNNRSHSYSGSRRQIVTDEIRLSPSSAAHNRAKELWEAGLSDAEIAREVGCNAGTVQGWVRTFKKRSQSPSQHRPFSEPFYRYIHARSVVEWLAVLQDEMRCNEISADETQDRSIILLCGVTKATARLFALIEKASSLEQNPMNGKIYAFCNGERDYLVYFHWDGSSFQRTKRQRDYGRYVWPSKKLGETIAVTPQEFAFILYGSQQKNIG